MSTYGRNFEFRTQPDGPGRQGRYINGASDFPIGAPAAVDTATAMNADGRLTVNVQNGGTVPPKPGIHGIAVFEYAAWAFNGDDPVLVTYSDKDLVKAGAPCYLVSGPDCKVLLRNTKTTGGNVAGSGLGVQFPTFFGQKTYATRDMVAGIGATPTVAVGDYLEPQSSPSDTNGYWVETNTRANAWLVVTSVDTARGEVEAKFMF